jgi:quinol monooxygenase YgiN
MAEIISVALIEPIAEEQELLFVLNELYSLMERKGYSRDELLRSRNEPAYFIHIRRWSSEKARQEAHEDPDVHRYWARLGQLCHIPRVHEVMDQVDWKKAARLR